MNSDFFELAFNESIKGFPYVYPNPPVGAVLAKHNKLFTCSFHKKFGGPHAEINAFNEFRETYPRHSLSDMDLYVTLEPCCSHGNTPPCVNAILDADIKNVYIAHKDYNFLNKGGAKILRANGVNVKFLDESARIFKSINYSLQPFLKWQIHKKPFVTLKAGLSLDGRIASRENISKWITDTESRQHSRLIRKQHHAVLIGKGTLLADDPSLDFDHGFSPNKKILLTDNLRFSKHLKLIKSGNLLIFTGNKIHSDSANKLRSMGHEIIISKNERFLMDELLSYLYDLNIQSVFVEGGSDIHGFFYDSFLNNALFLDRLLFYFAPFIMGGKESIPVVGGRGIKDPNIRTELLEYSLDTIGNGFCLDGRFNLYPGK